MSRHDDTVRLRHMLDHASEAVEIARDRTRYDLDRDRLLNLALVRLVEVIGEAANRMSEDTRRAYPEIPWADIAGSRHRLIHGYDSVDFDILWHIVSDDLRTLIPQLEAVLDEGG